MIYRFAVPIMFSLIVLVVNTELSFVPLVDCGMSDLFIRGTLDIGVGILKYIL